MIIRRAGLLVVLAGFLFVGVPLPAQQPSSNAITSTLFSEMRWRSIGPHRGGRTRSAAGHRSQPFTFYVGVCNGGVWKTTDAGRTWVPIFDDQPTNSIGAVVVAPSDPNILYVGSGEGLARPDLSVGDGMYKSTDAGKTWTHLGLRDGQQIANIAVDPANADRLFVAVVGHPYGPNRERGIYRSLDGGRTFQPVLQKDENVGGNDVDVDPSNPNIVYAAMWEERQGPWENAQWRGTGAGLFKSSDGGGTWTQLRSGLPNNGDITQANLAISPADPTRLFATVANGAGGGIYRSDDAGATWTQITTDNRPAGRIGGGDLPVPVLFPKNKDALVIVSTVSWKSVDGGRTWVPFKGAPGGEDYQGGWINPDNPDIVLLVADQGAVVSLNGGDTWSSWYNQPTAQLYHVMADNAFPYRVCSGQQESGSVCVSSRGNYGAISIRDYLPVGVDEYGYVAPDPLDPEVVFGGRNVSRFDRRTGQVSTVGPTGGRGGGAPIPGTEGLSFRQVRTHPVVFSGADPKALYFGNNYLWKTIDGAQSWQRISPDLTRATYALPATIGKYSDPSLVTQRGVIYTIGPSPREANQIWIGTDDGIIQRTIDGGLHWTDVTPPQLGPWWKVFMIDAGHFDGLTAYAAVNTLRLDDMRPHLYRTHDGGKTWTEIVAGMEGAGPANAIREDPKKKGLLYASTETQVYVSFDNGDHWQSLRLNMPASSVRDIIVKDDDLIAATHGRGFWILDDLTPLRQIDATTAGQDAVLFAPSTAWRVRWNMSTDMPWPKEEPTGKNPPDGAFINYYLRTAATGPVTLEVMTTDGKLVRRYSSTDPVTPVPEATAAPVPVYWYRLPTGLSAAPGMHRFMWDVHYQPTATAGGGGRGGGGGLPINSVPGNGAAQPTTAWVSPGTYNVKLTVNGKSYTQPIVVKADPRVRASALTMNAVYADVNTLYFGGADAQTMLAHVRDLRAKVAAAKTGATSTAAAALDVFDKQAGVLEIGSAGAIAGRVGAAAGGAGATPGGAGVPAGGAGAGARGAGAPARGAGAGAAAGGAAPGGRGAGAAGPAASPDSLAGLAGSLGTIATALTSADVAPTSAQRTQVTAAKANLAKARLAYRALETQLAAVNVQLRTAKIAEIPWSR